jgi:beta-lactamase regulating signal transducer with metallopeptidase domain
MGIAWFNIFIVLAAVLRRKNAFLASFSLVPLLFIMAVGLLRLFFSVEFPFTIEVTNTTWIPAVQDFFTASLIGTGRITVVAILCTIWITGTVIVLSVCFVQHLRFVRRTRKIPVHDDKDVIELLENVINAKKSKAHVSIRIKTDPLALSPYLAGFFKPTIYLPNIDLSEEEVRYIFEHEVRHYLFHDLWIKLLIQVLCAVFWWNPLVYLLRFDLDGILEIKCDIDIIGGQTREQRKHYYRSIAYIMSKVMESELPKTQPYSAWFVSAKSKNKLQQRLKLVLNYNPNRKRIKRNIILTCFCVVIAFAASYLFVAQPAYYPSPNDFLVPGDVFTITDENSYLVNNGDGTYSLFSDGEYRFSIDEGSLGIEPFKSLPNK